MTVASRFPEEVRTPTLVFGRGMTVFFLAHGS